MNLSSPPALFEVSPDVVSELYREGKVKDSLRLLPNESVILKTPYSSGLGIKKGDGFIHAVKDRHAFGLKGRNAEQKIALDLLLDPNVPITSLGGLAGTGKSVLAIAAALEQVLEQRLYSKVMVFKPLFPVGDQDLGFLPGDFDEKMDPWTQATWDALDVFCGDTVQDYILSEQLLEVLPLTHIRGRTFRNAVVIIDEAQNLTISTLVTALTRIGENSKVILTHDINQRDNREVGKENGVMEVIKRLFGHPLFASVNLHKVERSEVAKLVSGLFQDI